MDRKKRFQKIVFLIALLAMGMSIACCIMIPSHEFILSKNKLEGEKLKAVRGDGAAAYDVGDHYSYGKSDYANAIKWYTIGAENGFQDLQYILYNDLTRNNENKDSFTRGIFWLYKLVVVEYRESKRRLEDKGYTLETAKPPSDALFPRREMLTQSELTRYTEGALQGSGQAALVLANYLSTAGDAEEAEYWYRIGAQNGNRECMVQYGGILLGKEEMLDQERGKFWLGQADGG